jgi:hypothetical protein
MQQRHLQLLLQLLLVAHLDRMWLVLLMLKQLFQIIINSQLIITPFQAARYSSGVSCTETVQCLSAMSCTNSVCACSTNTYWTGSYCANCFSYDVACTSSSQCKTGMSCINSVCNCTTGYFWNGTNCGLINT